MTKTNGASAGTSARLTRSARSVRKRMRDGTLVSLAGSVVSKIVGALTAITIARLLGPTDLGVYAILASVMSVATVAAGFSSQRAVVKYTAGLSSTHPESIPQLYETAWTLSVFGGVTCAGVLFLVAPWLANEVFRLAQLRDLVWIASLSLIISAPAIPIWASLQGFQQFGQLNARAIALSAMNAAVVIPAVVLWGLRGVAISFPLVSMLSLWMNWRLGRRLFSEYQFTLRLRPSRVWVRKVLGYSLPAFGAALVAAPAFAVANSLLALNAGFTQLGLFLAAASLSDYLLFLPTTISISMVPIVSELSENQPARAAKVVTATMRLSLLATTFFSFALLVFGGPTIQLLYGPSYLGASAVFALLVPAMFFATIAHVVGFQLSGLGKTILDFEFTVVWMTAFMGTGWILIPRYGLEGLALSYLVSYVVYAGVSLGYAHFRLGVSVKRLRAIALLGIASLPIGAAAPTFLSDTFFLYTTGVLGLAAISITGFLLLDPLERDSMRVWRRVFQ